MCSRVKFKYKKKIEFFVWMCNSEFSFPLYSTQINSFVLDRTECCSEFFLSYKNTAIYSYCCKIVK